MAHKHSCKKYKLMTEEYIDGTISESDRRELEAHLTECVECRSELADARALRDLVKRSEDDIPEGMHERIMSAVAAEPKKAPKRSYVHFWRRMSVAAACLFICAGVCTGLLLMPMMKNNADAPSASTSEAGVSESFKEDSGMIGDPTIEAPGDNREEEAVPGDTDAPGADEEVEAVPGDTDEPEFVPPIDTGMADKAEQSSTASPSQTRPPVYEAPGAEGTGAKRPGGDEITLALLIVSGLLAVASFIAFLISLSSVRSGRHGKDNK
ncbi:MAG: zf-HC2 domain-containing protein [Eubacteriales bacterium]